MQQYIGGYDFNKTRSKVGRGGGGWTLRGGVGLFQRIRMMTTQCQMINNSLSSPQLFAHFNHQLIIYSMGKKIRYQYLTGSLLEPPLRYTKKLHIAINPISDPKGAQMARKWHVLGSKNREFFVQPNFECKMVEDLSSSSSYLVADFINGWKQGFYLRGSTDLEINNMFSEINYLIEFERTLQGHDDELEDEVEE